LARGGQDMILSLLAALFVVLVAAFWAFQGLFSSAIMLIETIAAIMVAFGYYEPLNNLWAEHIPEYGPGLALCVLFVVTLVVLRVAADKLIPTNVQFPLPVDRAGGGVLGLVIGLLLIGTTLVGIQLLPIGPTLLGFERLSTQAPGKRNSVWLNPDGFAVSMAGLLSSGRFGSETSFETSHPEYLADIGATNAGFQTESRRFMPSSVLTAKNYWKLDAIDQVSQQLNGEKWQREFTKAPPDDPSKRYLIVRVSLGSSAADKSED